MPRQHCTLLPRLLATWLTLTLLGWWLYHAAARGDAAPGSTQPAFIKLASNIVQTCCVPGWVLARKLTHHTLRGWWTEPLALGVGWAFCLTPIYLLWLLRSALAGPRVGRADLSRRRLLVNGAFAGGIGVAGAGGAGATLVVPWSLRVTKYQIPISDLSLELDGFRVAFLADTHLGARVPAAFLRRVVRDTLALRPDMVLLGGDYVHNDASLGPAAAEIFSPFIAERIPTLAVLGNHDWYAGGQEIRAALNAVGIETIDNDARFIDAATRRLTNSAPEDGLAVAGVGDLEMDVVDFDAALARVPASMPRLLLAHEPDTAEFATFVQRKNRVDLMLCGHTHGGQVKLPFIGTPVVPSAFGSKYAAGLVQGPACRVLVSRGIGTSIIPVRWGVPPEIVEITLSRA